MDNISYGSLDDCAAATIIQYRNTLHSGHWGINPPPSKTPHPSFLPIKFADNLSECNFLLMGYID